MIVVDLFAGAGGFSLAAERAGCRVAWAANHWPAAVATHAANHPGTEHVCQDLHQADWGAVPRHDLLLASPQCTGHSRARGLDRPHHDRDRSTAWAVVSALEACKPPTAIIENVPEFERWVLFPDWLSALRRLGYACARYVVDAADCGVAQHRVRLFCVLTRSRAPMALRFEPRPRVSARSIVDLRSGDWSPLRGRARPLSARTMQRIEAGRAGHGERFLVPYYGSARGGRSLDRPIGTLTTVDRYGVVDGDRYRMLTVDEIRRAMSFPEGHRVDANRRTAVRLYGNAVAPGCGEVVIRKVLEAA